MSLVASAAPAAAAAAATAAAATVSTAATTTAAATISTTAAATRAGTLFAGLGFIDGESAAAVVLPIEGGDCGLRLGIAGHLDKTKAFASAGHAIADDLCTLHSSVRGEKGFERGAI